MTATTLTLEGTYNFRDTGGLPLRAGGATRFGVLYRSDALGGLTEGGRAALASSAIRIIVDLRTADERTRMPNRLPEHVTFDTHELTILEGALVHGAKPAGLTPADLPKLLDNLPSLPELYRRLIEHSAPTFASIARCLAATGDRGGDRDESAAVVVHCTAGKDRTGVSIATLLDAVGVARPAIVGDYAQSQERLAGEWAQRALDNIRRMGIEPNEAITALATATPPAAIESALQWLDDNGGSEAYLLDGGLTAAELERVRERLTAQ